MSQDKYLDLTQYKKMFSIGSGSYADVYRVENILTGDFYAAKVSKFSVTKHKKDTPTTLLLFREINLMSLLNHPSILKFIGFSQIDFEKKPYPTIISEFATNGSLSDIINMEEKGLSPDDWNFTKKLINIYGIASGMSYLHKNKIIHRDLKPENILLDDYLYPKISDFGFSKITEKISESMNFQSQSGYKGSVMYMSPESLREYNYSTMSDVYAFGIIICEILNGERSFKNIYFGNLIYSIAIECKRPEIKSDVPEVFRQLIEKCWSQSPEERPTFNDIVNELKTNKNFVNELVDEFEFFDYVDFIDEYHSTFDSTKQLIHFDDFIKIHGRKKKAKKVVLNKIEIQNKIDNDSLKPPKEFKIENNEKSTKKPENENVGDTNSKQINDTNPRKIIEENTNIWKIKEDFDDVLYPISEFNKLSYSCQNLVEEAQRDPSKQFIVGKSLIEEENGFPQNIDLGFQYIKQSNKNKYIDSIFYYIKHLIKGKFIPQNLNEAEKCLDEIIQSNDSRILFYKGQLCFKKDNYSEAIAYFKLGKNERNNECTYKLAKMIFIGKGIKKNVRKSIELLKSLKNIGYQKSIYFLKAMKISNKNIGLSSFPEETQMIFILKIINFLKKDTNNEFQDNQKFSEIKFYPHETELFLYNKSLNSFNFHKILTVFQNVYFEIEYPSKSFKQISDHIIKIIKKYGNNIKIGINISSFSEENFQNECFSPYFSYHKIDKSIKMIPKRAFKDCKSLLQIFIPSHITIIETSTFEECSSLTEIIIPSSVTKIKKRAFSRCLSLKQISIPSSITTIKKNTFFECTSLVQISIPSSITSIEECAFKGCSSLMQIILPSSVISIGKSAFSGCSSLRQISIPFNVKSIEESTFNRCLSLKQITIPSSVTSIGQNSFNECFLLEQIIIPSSVISIKENAFQNCASLTEIIISSSVNEIGFGVFSGCSALRNISIPASVKTIGDNAFRFCISLEQISIPFHIKADNLGLLRQTKIIKYS